MRACLTSIVPSPSASRMATTIAVLIALLGLSALRLGANPHEGHTRRMRAAAGPAAGVAHGPRLGAASPLTTTSTPGGFATVDPSSYPTRPTPTRRPTIDPTSDGGPIVVAAPLPTAALAPDAITARTAFAVREIARLVPPTEGGEGALAFSPDARTMYSLSGREHLVARTLPEGDILWQRDHPLLEWSPILAVSPDGRTLAAVGSDGLRMLDAATGETLRRHAVGARSLTFADHGRRLAMRDEYGYAAAWDVTSGAVLADRQVVRDAELSERLRPGAAEIGAVIRGENALVVFDILSGARLWTLPPPSGTADRTGLFWSWSRAGRFLAWTVYPGWPGTGTEWVCRTDLRSEPVCAPMDVHGRIALGAQLIVTDDGLVVAAGERHSHSGVCQTFVVDVMDGHGRMRNVFAAERRQADGMAVSPDGSLIAVSHYSCDDPSPVQTDLIAIDQGRSVAQLIGVGALEFTPDGRRFVAVDRSPEGAISMRLYGVVPGSGEGRRAWLPVAWAGR